MSGKRVKKEKSESKRMIIGALAFLSVACIVSGMMQETKVEYVEQEVQSVQEVEEQVYIYRPEIPLSEELQKVVYDTCAEYDVPVNIVLGVINTESMFDEYATNGICHGLMQISEINADRLLTATGVTDIISGSNNIRCGVYMLSELYQKYGDWNMALIAYNRGERGAQRDCFDLGIYSNTYTDKVNGYAEYWKAYTE